MLHGFGHGSLQRSAIGKAKYSACTPFRDNSIHISHRVLTSALKLCGRFPTRQLMTGCSEGVYMTYATLHHGYYSMNTTEIFQICMQNDLSVPCFQRLLDFSYRRCLHPGIPSAQGCEITGRRVGNNCSSRVSCSQYVQPFDIQCIFAVSATTFQTMMPPPAGKFVAGSGREGMLVDWCSQFVDDFPPRELTRSDQLRWLACVHGSMLHLPWMVGLPSCSLVADRMCGGLMKSWPLLLQNEPLAIHAMALCKDTVLYDAQAMTTWQSYSLYALSILE